MEAYTKKAPARPEGPSHCAARANGSQIYSPYTTFAAEVEMIPKSPKQSWMSGRKSTCQYTPFSRLRYRVKSGMLQIMVAQPPVIEEREERINHDRVEPVTLYSCFQISPAPPAFLVITITVATQVIDTTTTDYEHGFVSIDYALTKLEYKEPLQLMWWSQKYWELDRPKHQM